MKIKLLFLLFLTSLSIYSQNLNIPENGLLAYYAFSGNANDSSGKGNNGIATDVTLTTDRFGNNNSAYSFNGTSSTVESTIANYPLKGGSQTITGWFKAATPTVSQEFDFCLLNYGNIDDPAYWFKISFYRKGYLDLQFDSKIVSSQENYFNNQWTFFAMTLDEKNNTYSLYINGVYKMGGTATLYTNGVNALFRIGRNKLNNYFEGAIDDIGVWNRVLTQEEITSLSNPGNSNAFTLIPDINFEKKLIALGIDSGVEDGKVLTQNIAAITSLNVSSSSIQNLTGIEDFVALTNLNCRANLLTKLNLSSNTALTYINCSSNQLTNLDVSNNTALTNLYCDNNRLNSLDTSYNPALTEFYCSSNYQLTNLNVTKNTALARLKCDNNKLANLDVSNNAGLTYLYCSGNKLTILDVSKNTSLDNLNCAVNLLTDLNVSNNTALTILSCTTNQLTSLDVSKNTALTDLFCGNNQLTVLNLKNGKNTSISTNLEFTYNPYLTCIQVDDVAYANANWSGKKDAIASFNTNCPDSNVYTLIPDVNFEQKLIDYGIESGKPDGKVLTAKIKTLQNLNVSNSAITDLTGIQDFTSLTILNCSQNSLTALNVSKNTLLKTLNCNNNKLETLDISNNIALDTLSSYTNRLTALDVKKNKALKKLDCGSNQISSLDVSANTALLFLGCNTSLLTTLDISNNTALTLLDCRENKLKDLNVTANTALTELYCQSNQLATLDIQKNKILEFLNCSKNQLTTLDVSGNTALVGLYSNSNQLTNLNLKNGNNAKIAYLNLTNNPNLNCIQVDDPIYFNSNWDTKKDAAASYDINCASYYTLIPDSNFEQKLIDLGIDTDGLNGKITITNISSITSLDLSNSTIKDLTGIENFTALQILDCSNNQLTSLDLSKNTNLQILYVTGNPLKYINLQNGNNQNLIIATITAKKVSTVPGTSFLGITTLGCIKVDNADYANANWSRIKETTTLYSETCTLGLEDSYFNKAVVYPNPTKGVITISNAALDQASVYNSTGQLVRTFTLDSANTNNTINLSSLAKGVYYLYLISQDAASAKKIIVE